MVTMTIKVITSAVNAVFLFRLLLHVLSIIGVSEEDQFLVISAGNP